eukprot:Nk52_evm6s269 gene=Nk52_evmTU6s269
MFLSRQHKAWSVIEKVCWGSPGRLYHVEKGAGAYGKRTGSGKRFVDHRRVTVKAGAGGQGHQKSGSPGGNGGSIIAKCDPKVTSLGLLEKAYRAESGANASEMVTRAASARNVVVPVPVGTSVLDQDGNLLGDLMVEGQSLVIAQGGRGGSLEYVHDQLRMDSVAAKAEKLRAAIRGKEEENPEEQLGGEEEMEDVSAYGEGEGSNEPERPFAHLESVMTNPFFMVKNLNMEQIKASLKTVATPRNHKIRRKTEPQGETIQEKIRKKTDTEFYGMRKTVSELDRDVLEKRLRPQPGEKKVIQFELKSIADVGLVGFPNAGKSSLLKALSRASPEIANYPFTTLRPQIGVINYDTTELPQLSYDLDWQKPYDIKSRRILMADIPGLVEGAHANRGRGNRFLKHIDRTSILVLMVDLEGFQLSVNDPKRNASETMALLLKELSSYDSALLEKPVIVAVNKIDCEGATAKFKEFETEVKDMSFGGKQVLPFPSFQDVTKNILYMPISTLYRHRTLDLKELLFKTSCQVSDEPLGQMDGYEDYDCDDEVHDSYH